MEVGHIFVIFSIVIKIFSSTPVSHNEINIVETENDENLIKSLCKLFNWRIQNYIYKHCILIIYHILLQSLRVLGIHIKNYILINIFSNKYIKIHRILSFYVFWYYFFIFFFLHDIYLDNASAAIDIQYRWKSSK